MFSYLSRHSGKEEINKQQFVLLLQSLELRIDVGQIASLFGYLEEGRSGVVLRSKWEDRLNMVYIEL